MAYNLCRKSDNFPMPAVCMLSYFHFSFSSPSVLRYRYGPLASFTQNVELPLHEQGLGKKNLKKSMQVLCNWAASVTEDLAVIDLKLLL